ncbi:MAG: hypothetical protein K6D94_06405 [Clostridiales bacterium]|nr:hypothetical protein [Clostridiales bacterium]
MIDFNLKNKYADRQVTPETMREVRASLDTPVKRGAVMEFDDRYTDCPGVFRYRGRWYMYFIAISKDVKESGYETHLAASDDLLHWGYIGRILRRDSERTWDSRQIAGYPALYDPRVGRGCELSTHDGKYWMTYLAGDSDGYEPDPLLMGAASCADPLDADSFVRCDQPIMTPQDSDARFFETKTLYKSAVIRDEERLTGHEFFMMYNAKAYDNHERIYMAVSDDMKKWTRYGGRPVIDDITGDPECYITADPMMMRRGDGLYVMNIMKFNKSRGAFDTFACSYDLNHWTEWLGEPTVYPSKDDPDQDVYAHKPWIITWEGHVYHFYCACTSDNRRYIALATDF